MSNRCKILHRARQYHCHALYKISKRFNNWYKVKGKRDFAIFGFRMDNLYLNKRRRRELALLKAEPGKNWNSFETFIFVTLRGSSYKINQDPGREKSGRHFWKPFSRWPTSKIAKIKNKHNFGIINPMKLILVSNSIFWAWSIHLCT